MLDSRGKGLRNRIAHFVFTSLLLTPLIYSSACSFSLADEINSHFNLHFIESEIVSKISIPDINAKVEDASGISRSELDKVQSYNLEESVRDLSSFHTRHSESESIDDVAYWLAEKLRYRCLYPKFYIFA
jgi:hypothetical protein